MKTLQPRVALLEKPAMRSAHDRPRGHRNQRERAAVFRDQPLCVQCEQDGRVALATVRDHIVPLADGGADSMANSQGLCSECHAVKTRAEARRRYTDRDWS